MNILNKYTPISLYNELLERVQYLENVLNINTGSIEPTGDTSPIEPTGETGEEPTGTEPTGEEPTENVITGEQVVFSIIPTAESILEQLGENPIKPEDQQTLNMTKLSGPTNMYLAFPYSWLVLDDEDNLVKPKITNSLGFETGYALNNTVNVNGVEYGVFSVEFGKDTYRIAF